MPLSLRHTHTHAGMDREVTSDELEAAARVANAIEFINKLPEA